MFGHLFKAVVAVAVTPVALVADIVTLPASAGCGRLHPFHRTGALLNSAGKNISNAVKPE